MADKHQDKYVTQLLLAFTFISAGVLLIFYACFERAKTDDWYFWGVLVSILISMGLYFITNACIHKVKSDLIKRQKLKEQQKAIDHEE